MNKKQFIKDNLKFLSEEKLDEVLNLIKSVKAPKPWRVSIDIDTDDDFVIVTDSGERKSWGHDEIKYFDTEQECFDWLTQLANKFHWEYDEKKHTAWMVRDWILELVEEREFERCMGGNQTVDISISNVGV